MQLPPGLQPWGEALAPLDPELAIALGPLVRQLDQLITRQDVGSGTHGPLDGYDGITRHGSPARLLISEWALADAVPDEFLRRAANAELLYLEPAYQQDRQRAGVAVLIDCGPDQLGAGRLVQLAALIVLLRRATARGHELSIGILGDEPGAWQGGEPTAVLANWVTARRAEEPDPAEIEHWEGGDEELWVLAGPRLAKQLPGRRRLLVSREAAWGDDGPTAAEVRLGGDRIELALPRRDLAIRALRGAALQAGPAVATASGGGRTRFAAFTGAPRRLLARGNDLAELVALTVESESAKPRHYRLGGTVVAAAVFSRRVVALVLIGQSLQVEVIGKVLGRLDRLSVQVSELRLTVADLNDLAARDLPPLYFSAGALICPLGDRWWRLHPTEPPEELPVVAVAAGHKLDEPRTSTEPVIFGQNDLIARHDGDAWLISPQDQRADIPIHVPPGAKPFGLLTLERSPTLLCFTPADGTIQLCTLTDDRALPHFSGVLRTPSLHPFAPLLAIELEHRVDVVDLTDNTLVATLRGDE
ncbi:hypothetical protein [Kribbella sp. NPDC023855]|uniref:hypothetical protein n=1 Tax=Kribbella sp. NPDC023855 TaxID=3154698 RepID=UPI0033E02A5E